MLRAILFVAALALPLSANAWHRGAVTTFAVLPEGASGPEGIEVDAAGNVYVATFGTTATGFASGPGRIYVYDPQGRLVRPLTVAGSTAMLLGLRFHPTTGALLVIDFGAATVLDVDPDTGAATPFMTVPATGAGLNDLTFDRAGNVYVSDSFLGVIWRTGPTGGVAAPWVEDALLRTTGVPPFGANGLRFDQAEGALFVCNTGDDTIVRIPVAGGVAGAPAVFVNSVNGADGLLIDDDDNLWVAANQADEIVVLDPSGMAIAKLGDFDGLRHGSPVGLLFPASLRFTRGGDLVVTNLALDLRLFGLAPSPDSAWAAQVTRYTVSRVHVNGP